MECLHGWRHRINDRLICKYCRKDLGAYEPVRTVSDLVVYLLGYADVLSSWELGLMQELEKKDKLTKTEARLVVNIYGRVTHEGGGD